MSLYSQLTKTFSQAAGKPAAFFIAIAFIVIWLITGPFFGFSDTRQLIINTATTIVTFIMVFIIQNTQNRDTEAMQVKLDELIRVTKKAQNSLLDIEDLDEDEINMLKEKYINIAKTAIKEGLKNKNTGSNELKK